MSRHIAIALAAALGMALCSASARAQFAPAIAPPTDPGVYAPSPAPIAIPPAPPTWIAPAPVPATTAAPGAAFTFFDWTTDSNDPDNSIIATMSPDLCDQFYKSGLSTTAGTVTAQMPATTAPAVLSATPGPMVLLLAGNRYGDPVYLGEGFEGDRKVFVIKLKKIGSPVTDPSVPNILGIPLPNGAPTAYFGGNWTTGVGQFHAPRNLTLSQSGNTVTGSYVRTGNDGRTYSGNIDNGVVTGNTLKFHWTDGGDSGVGTFEMAANGQGFTGSYTPTNGGPNNWDGWNHVK